MQNRLRFCLIGLVPLLLSFASGCSVYLALEGKPDPDVSALQVGATRGQIELQLGKAVNTKKAAEGGTLDLYEYYSGDTPSPGRALAHGAMDVLTLCLWEIVGTPIEAVQGTKKSLEIQYDQNDYAMTIRRVAEQPAEATKSTPES